MHTLVRHLVCSSLLLGWWAASSASEKHPPSDPPAPGEAVSDTAATDRGPARALARAPAKARPAPVDPMQHLREKLAARLGAAKAPGAKSEHVVRISTQASSGAAADPQTEAALARASPRVAVTATAKPPHRAAAHTAHWSYEGDAGPDRWSRLKPEFAKCASGTRQSPIDIRDGIRVDLDPVQFDYRPSGFRVLDNGHTVQVNVAAGNSIEVMGRRYELVQFHFHRPSEERVEGRQFEMVAHLVHKDPDGRIAVVAVLIERGPAHPLVQTVWNNLPLEKGDEVAARSTIDLTRLLPDDGRYYTYMGSLTTPPCSEGVLWVVMQQPVTVSAEQIDVFARLYPMNARPIQQAAGRRIKQSN
jgi:carbonic anhydrase